MNIKMWACVTTTRQVVALFQMHYEAMRYMQRSEAHGDLVIRRVDLGTLIPGKDSAVLPAWAILDDVLLGTTHE